MRNRCGPAPISRCSSSTDSGSHKRGRLDRPLRSDDSEFVVFCFASWIGSGKGANWVTISPDDKTAYVANPQTNDASGVDIKSLKEVARVPVGFAPSRNTAWLAP